MKELLDSNNKELVAEIESIVPINFIQHKESCYQATVKKDLKGEPTLAKLWYYEPLSQAKLAHELYHIKIAVLLGDNASMIILPEENLYASIFYNKEYCTDFLNHIEHLIFYNIYKDAGYSDNDFFEYVNPEKAAMHYQNIISNGIKNEKGLYNIYRLQEYIRLLVLYIYFPIDNRFKKEKKELKRIAPEMYNIYNTLYKMVKTIQIKEDERKRLQDLYMEFRKQVIAWINLRKFI